MYVSVMPGPFWLLDGVSTRLARSPAVTVSVVVPGAVSRVAFTVWVPATCDEHVSVDVVGDHEHNVGFPSTSHVVGDAVMSPRSFSFASRPSAVYWTSALSAVRDWS